jgi:hypothetical protein
MTGRLAGIRTEQFKLQYIESSKAATFRLHVYYLTMSILHVGLRGKHHLAWSSSLSSCHRQNRKAYAGLLKSKIRISIDSLARHISNRPRNFLLSDSVDSHYAYLLKSLYRSVLLHFTSRICKHRRSEFQCSKR